MAGWRRETESGWRIRIRRHDVEVDASSYTVSSTSWWTDWRIWWLAALTISQIAYMIVDAFV